MSNRKIRVVSLNTWKNEGQYENRIQLIVDGLRMMNPDVILLQECFRCSENGYDTAAILAGSLGLHCHFAPAREKLREHNGETLLSYSGLAILSTFPCLDSWVLKLPSSVDGGERISFFCELEIENYRMGIVCIHFSHIRNEVDIRAKQLEHTLRALSSLRKRFPCVLGGDFNCVPDSVEVKTAEGLAGDSINVLPVFGVLQETSPIPRQKEISGRQIDQIWVLQEVGSVRRIHVNAVDGGLCLGKKDTKSGLYPSDHAGVWADLEICPEH